MWENIIYILSTEMEFVLRLILSCICGGLVGYERSRRHKEAGIRTHIIVALGAAMMMIVSKYAFFDVLAYKDITVDASRVAANVITGVSFLGAGVIFVRGVSIRGLTTAAGLWATAGIGLAIGGGLYVVGIATTMLIVLVQVGMLNHLQRFDGPVYETLTVTYEDCVDGIERLKLELATRKILIHHIKMDKNDDHTVTVSLQVSREMGNVGAELADILAKDEHVKSFSL